MIQFIVFENRLQKYIIGLTFFVIVILSQSCRSSLESFGNPIKVPSKSDRFGDAIEALFEKHGVKLDDFEEVFFEEAISEEESGRWVCFVGFDLREEKRKSNKPPYPVYFDVLMYSDMPPYAIKRTSYRSIETRLRVFNERIASELNKKKSDVVDGVRVWYR